MPAKPVKTPEKKRGEAEEPEPMDPKAASRAIGQHLDKKRSGAFLTRAPGKTGSQPEPETKILMSELPPRLAGAPAAVRSARSVTPARPRPNPVPRTEDGPAAPARSPAAAPAAAAPAPASRPTPLPAPALPPGPAEISPEKAAAGRNETVTGSPIDDRLLLLLLEDTPRSLLECWVRTQAGDMPERAVKTSKTEVEFLLLQKAAMD